MQSTTKAAQQGLWLGHSGLAPLLARLFEFCNLERGFSLHFKWQVEPLGKGPHPPRRALGAHDDITIVNTIFFRVATMLVKRWCRAKADSFIFNYTV